MELGLGTQKMDLSLARYNTINDKLGFVVDEIRTKKLLMTDLNRKNRILIRKNDEYIQSFKTAVYWVVQYVDDFD
jgi:hypothetical protein